MLLALKVWMVAMMSGIAVLEGNGEDYNKEEHALLCNVLSAAVKRWGKNGENVSGALKEALQQTIFGTNRDGLGDPEKLTLQGHYYNLHENSHHNRMEWCGSCRKMYFPGESLPHDLLCLCTPGVISTLGGGALCGRSGWGLVEGGWGAKVQFMGAEEKASLESTWKEVIQKCMSSETRQGLKSALFQFKEKVKGNKYRFGWRGSEQHHGPSCDGMNPSNICVDYKGNGPAAEACTTKAWWSKLYEAIKNEPPEEKIETPTKAAKKRVEIRNHSKITAEAPKTKKLTIASQTKLRESGNLITWSPWSFLDKTSKKSKASWEE